MKWILITFSNYFTWSWQQDAQINVNCIRPFTLLKYWCTRLLNKTSEKGVWNIFIWQVHQHILPYLFSSFMTKHNLHLPEVKFCIKKGKSFLHTIPESSRPLKHEININRAKNRWDTISFKAPLLSDTLNLQGLTALASLSVTRNFPTGSQNLFCRSRKCLLRTI